MIPKTLIVARIRKVTQEAKAPTWAGANRLGFYIYSSEEYFVEPGKRAVCQTALSVICTKGYYVRIISPFTQIMGCLFNVEGQTLDPRVQQEIFVSVVNYNKKTVHINKGDIIAQIAVGKTEYPTVLLE